MHNLTKVLSKKAKIPEDRDFLLNVSDLFHDLEEQGVDFDTMTVDEFWYELTCVIESTK